MGYYLNDDELNRVFGRFKDLADRKKTVYDEDLISLIETEVIYKSVPEHFRLEELVVLTGTTVKPNATVKMKIGDDLKTTSAFGDGPIDATYRAITSWPSPSASSSSLRCPPSPEAPRPWGKWRCAWKTKAPWSPARAWTRTWSRPVARAYINGLNRLKFTKEMGPKMGKPEEL